MNLREKRQHARAPLGTPVRVEWDAADESQVQTELEARDISIGGIFVLGPAPAPIGTRLVLHFHLPHVGATSLPGFIRWNNAEGFGVQFGLIGPRETRAIGLLLRDLHASRAS